MLQFFSPSGAYIATLEKHSFGSFKYASENTVGIEGNPEPYLGAVCRVYFDSRAIGSGVVTGYKHDKNTNLSELSIQPLTLSLNGDFVQDLAYLELQDGEPLYMQDDSLFLLQEDTTIDKSYDDDIANILEDLIFSTTSLLYVKSKVLTGRNLKIDFVKTTILEAWNLVVNKFIGTDFVVRIGIDGGVDIGAGYATHEMTYGNDIKKIKYEKDASEIINYIVFTNNAQGAELIEKTYEDTESIAKYGKRVKFIQDERFLYEESADEYCNQVLLTKGKAQITVESIDTIRTDIQVGDKISISNWEKNFDDELYVNSLTFKDSGLTTLDIGSKRTRTDYLTI